MSSPTVKNVRRAGWTMVIASLLGLAALLCASGCAEDDQQRHVGQTCHKVIYSACLRTERTFDLACAMVSATNKGVWLRLDGYSQFPVVEGDEWCGKWREVAP
jgi:hypothetical protein